MAQHPGTFKPYKGPPTFNGSDFGYPLKCNGSIPDLYLSGHYGSLYAMCAMNEDPKRVTAKCKCKRQQDKADLTICQSEEYLEPWYLNDPTKAKESFGRGIENIKQYCGTWCTCPGQYGYDEPEAEPKPNVDFACPCNWTYISTACCFSDTGIIWEPPENQLPGQLDPPDGEDWDGIDDYYYNETKYEEGGGGD
ncbi:MAG: hypothetical protein M1814_005214 [Vezdaea aestivalis]|nr:MAG: hypothetical protein M1814_005214 [Vezdaea aestivalis]